MSKKNKKRKYCPYCQAKQRTIDRLKTQLRNREYEVYKLYWRHRPDIYILIFFPCPQKKH